jgi:hypothetical protein
MSSNCTYTIWNLYLKLYCTLYILILLQKLRNKDMLSLVLFYVEECS